jgi:hypothetical protein
MNSKTITAVVLTALPLLGAPVAGADPVEDGDPDVYGLMSQGESHEVWENGLRNCVTLDQADGTVASVVALVNSYQAKGWDVESSMDIVYQSVADRCPEHTTNMQKAMRTFGDFS